MADWACTECGHEVMTMDENPPYPFRWTDGHVCRSWKRVNFQETLPGVAKEKKDEGKSL